MGPAKLTVYPTLASIRSKEAYKQFFHVKSFNMTQSDKLHLLENQGSKLVSAWPLLPNLCPCHFKCNETTTSFSTTNTVTDSTTQTSTTKITKTTKTAVTTTENTVQITNVTSELPLTTSPSTNIISTTEDLNHENAMQQSISASTTEESNNGDIKLVSNISPTATKNNTTVPTTSTKVIPKRVPAAVLMNTTESRTQVDDDDNDAT